MSVEFSNIYPNISIQNQNQDFFQTTETLKNLAKNSPAASRKVSQIDEKAQEPAMWIMSIGGIASLISLYPLILCIGLGAGQTAIILVSLGAAASAATLGTGIALYGRAISLVKQEVEHPLTNLEVISYICSDQEASEKEIESLEKRLEEERAKLEAQKSFEQMFTHQDN